MEITRIYHRYENWECYKAGFFNSCSGANKPALIAAVVGLFSVPLLTKHWMERVIEEWPKSTEHNLTNTAMNRVAWLGQSACCLYAGVPSTVTMEAWSDVPEQWQKEANQIAEQIIKEYEQNLSR